MVYSLVNEKCVIDRFPLYLENYGYFVREGFTLKGEFKISA